MILLSASRNVRRTWPEYVACFDIQKTRVRLLIEFRESRGKCFSLTVSRSWFDTRAMSGKLMGLSLILLANMGSLYLVEQPLKESLFLTIVVKNGRAGARLLTMPPDWPL